VGSNDLTPNDSNFVLVLFGGLTLLAGSAIYPRDTLAHVEFGIFLLHHILNLEDSVIGVVISEVAGETREDCLHVQSNRLALGLGLGGLDLLGLSLLLDLLFGLRSRSGFLCWLFFFFFLVVK